MSSETMEPPIGASAWDLEMFEYLTNHATREGLLLQEYVDAAATTESKAFAFAIGLLVEDERRHHRHFADLAASLKHEAELVPDDPVVPRLDFAKADLDALLDVTRRLLANEEHDSRELKRLRHQLRDIEDTSMWALLVDTMLLDTMKHLAILRFVERRAKKLKR